MHTEADTKAERLAAEQRRKCSPDKRVMICETSSSCFPCSLARSFACSLVVGCHFQFNLGASEKTPPAAREQVAPLRLRSRAATQATAELIENSICSFESRPSQSSWLCPSAVSLSEPQGKQIRSSSGGRG